MNSKKRFCIFALLLVVVISALGIECHLQFPENINIYKGEELLIGSSSPYKLSMPANFGGVLSPNGEITKDTYHTQEKYIKINETGNYSASIKLFGVIPVRDVKVNVNDTKMLIPGGDTIGIKMFTEGLLCVGTSDIADANGNILNPASMYDIKAGDIIISANGTKLDSTEKLAEIITSSMGKEINLEIKRGEESIIRKVFPVSAADGYKIGIWLRDSTAGIGTVSFVDEENKTYGALGHPICDADTGVLIPVSQGSVLKAEIFDIKKGEKGEPGELKGTFSTDDNIFGTVSENTANGLFGDINQSFLKNERTYLPICSKGAVKRGKAQIISTIDDSGKQTFDIEIIKVNRGIETNGKNMVIEITDPYLLKKTGGIVQGMSGSPIIQNGKIVGAVTHVFVNDPTRGYGIFIENMLAEAEEIK